MKGLEVAALEKKLTGALGSHRTHRNRQRGTNDEVTE
jgi:hypothetical protein